MLELRSALHLLVCLLVLVIVLAGAGTALVVLIVQTALRVLLAETRLTVYRRRPVFVDGSFDHRFCDFFLAISIFHLFGFCDGPKAPTAFSLAVADGSGESTTTWRKVRH